MAILGCTFTAARDLERGVWSGVQRVRLILWVPHFDRKQYSCP